MQEAQKSLPSAGSGGFRPRSHNTAVDWQSLLRWLDQPNHSRTLPAGMVCPFCKSPFASILQDRAAGGQWFACLGCGWSGDMIELAAAVRQLGIPATITHLSQRGVPWSAEQLTPASIRKYEVRHIAVRRRLKDLWRHAQSDRQLLRKPGLGRLLGQLQLSTDLQGERWLKGPGAMIAGMSREAVEQAIHPGSARQGGPAAYKGKYGNDPSQARLFKGGGWHDLVALPYFDMPGRISTFQFFGREGRIPEDQVSKTICYGAIGPTLPPPDAGLAFHPKVREIAAAEQMLVCVNDPLLMLRLQWKAFRTSHSPLPMAAWLDDGYARTSWAWDQWSGQRLIFWAFDWSAPLLRQLVEQNAEVSLVRPPAKETLTRYLCHVRTKDLMDRVQRHATPWPEALGQFVLSKDSEVLKVLAEYQLAGGDVDALLDKLPKRPREVVESLVFPGSRRRRVVTSFGFPIVETDEGWHEQLRSGENRLICDAVLRVEHVFPGDEHRGTKYAGRILYRGSEIPFCDDCKIIDDSTREWMQAKLREAKCGFLQCDPKHARRLCQIAISFHQPEFHDCFPRIGWDRDALAFVLPQAVIRRDGEVRKTDHPWLPDDTPGLSLAQPDACRPSHVASAVQDSPSYRAFWAVFAALTANVVAPALCERPCGLALVGHGAQVLGQTVARLFGCLATSLSSSTVKLEESHGWPLYVAVKRQQLKPLVRWLSGDYEERQCIAPLDYWKATALQLTGNWRIIELDDMLLLPSKLAAAAPYLLPAYLQDLCQRRLLLADGPDFLTQVVNDLADWATRMAANGSLIKASRDLLHGDCDEDVRTAFGEMLAKLVLTGEVTCLPPGFAGELDPQTIARVEATEHRPAGVFMSRQVLPRALRRRDAPIPDPLRITEIVGRGPLLEEGEIGGQAGWLLDATWWNAAVHRHRAAKARLLQIVG